MGSKYHDGETEFATTSAVGRIGCRWDVIGWMFWARVGEMFINTIADGVPPYPDEDTAKREAVAWVKARMNDQEAI